MRGWIKSLVPMLLCVIALMPIPALAASWNAVRDGVMSQREGRNYQAAYLRAAGFHATRASDAFDSQFVSGWLALRFLNRPDLAITHFKRMATEAPRINAAKRDAGKAQAGYWLGRALQAAGRKKEAETMYRAATVYANTFYGQLAAAELKIGLPSSLVAGMAGSYPVKDIYWHDRRARKELVLAVIREESRFRQAASSPKGAKGLMQVMPETAKHIGRSAGVDVDLKLMRTNPDYNVAVGSRYLADQLDRYRGNAMLAAAAYNAGPRRVDDWLERFGDPRGGRVDPVDWIESIPFSETREYVKKVIGSYVTYLALASR